MFNAIRSWSAKRSLKRARADLAYARATYAAAKRRGDTRGQHEAHLALRTACRAALMAEVALFQTRSPRSRSGAVTSQHWVSFQ